MRMFYISILLLINVSIAFGAHEPSPLKDLKIEVSVNSDGTNGLFHYTYSITNPQANDSPIVGIEIFLSRDPKIDQEPLSSGLSQCSEFYKATSASALRNYPMIPVGSQSPHGWSCSYGKLAEFTEGSFGWGGSTKKMIKPGTTQGGFVLHAYALPGVRDVLVEADIDFDQLPDEYSENIEKTKELTQKINWLGKTVGPKAPPKVFNATSFSEYLRTLTTQAVAQNWIRDQGFLKSLEAKLDQITKKITASDYATARNVLNAFLSEVDAQKGKHLSLEAYALLYFNGKYLLSNLPEKVKAPAN